MAVPSTQGRCDEQFAPSLNNANLLFMDDEGAFAIFQCNRGYTFYSDTAGVLWCDRSRQLWLPHESTCYVDNSTILDTTTSAVDPLTTASTNPLLSSTTTANVTSCTDCGDDNFLTNTVVAALPGSTAALIVVGIVAGILLLFVAAMCFLINRRRKQRKNLKGDDGYLFWGTTSGKRNRLVAWLASLPSQPRQSIISDQSGSQKQGSGLQPGVRRLHDDTGPDQTSIYIDSHTGKTVKDLSEESWQGEVSDKLKLLSKGRPKRYAPDGVSVQGKLSSRGDKSVKSVKLDEPAGKFSAITVNGVPVSPVGSVEVLPPGIPQPYDIEAPPSLASSFQEIGAVIYPDLDDIQFRRAIMIDVTSGRDSMPQTMPISTHL